MSEQAAAPALSHNRPWTAAQDEMLDDASLTNDDLAAILSRSPIAVRNRRDYRAKLLRGEIARPSRSGEHAKPSKPVQIVERRCLDCRRRFATPRHLFVCDACKETLEWKAGAA